ncbi:MAG: flagellar hook-associated protein FlgK [Planctomycetales bacterium]|nr:flagellar hook-associated protein FlgK [Planctomycetales bacterium]
MSLFGSLQMAGNTLQAMQIGLHVVGNNIANASTPGYVRERAIFTPAPVQQLGKLAIGLGVEVAGIVQSVDKFVESRLRDAGGDRASAEVQEKVYRDIQAILGELTDTDISTALTQFFNSLDDVAQNPEDIDFRNLAIGNGVTLAERINTLDRRIRAEHQDFNSRVEQIALEINTLTEQISELNLKIVTTEGGGSTASQAGGLRSQRQEALKKLAEIVDVTVVENDTGSVNVSINGEILVFEGTRREVSSVLENEGGDLFAATIRYTDNNSPLTVGGGELHGIYESRDKILGGFLDGLDNFAATLAFEFNKLYSQGQGIDGFTEIVSTFRVEDADAPLNEAGLDFTPVNGNFNLIVHNLDEDSTKTYAIAVDLNGLDGNDTSLSSLASAINAVDGISAEVNSDNQLVIRSDSQDIEFAFGLENQADDSHVLAALGINTFFTGSSARSLGVNEVLRTDRQAGAKFAAGLAGETGVNIENALRLSGFHDETIEGLKGSSISGAYDQLLNDTTRGATVAAAVADGLRVFEGTLDASAQAVSGVNLDEEAIDMIQLQRTYQASARYIQTLSELLDVLVAL